MAFHSDLPLSEPASGDGEVLDGVADAPAADLVAKLLHLVPDVHADVQVGLGAVAVLIVVALA